MCLDSDEHGLVIRGHTRRRETVKTGRKTAGHRRTQDAILRHGIQRFEEHEAIGICGRDLIGRRETLDDDLHIAQDIARRVDDLRRGQLRLPHVRYMARLQIVDRELDGKVGVRGDRGAGLREDEFRGGHVGGARDYAHRRRVARSRQDLSAVCDLQVGPCRAEVDKVVQRGERGYLASNRFVLTVVIKKGGNDGLDER